MKKQFFLDSNIWIYAYAEKGKTEIKHSLSRNLIDEHFNKIILSTQTLSEIYNVLTKKHLLDLDSSEEVIGDLINHFQVNEVKPQTVLKALKLRKQLQYSYWDCLMLSSALLSDCSIFYSEDLQHNQLIENKLRIVNPFI
ncbi:MAG: PIN domain-containing protein [Candidatus Caenarcaniphilales bacterium]|nr:PIN domain-containing protein [Candidatus Caenarcaniphilales bacterium]